MPTTENNSPNYAEALVRIETAKQNGTSRFRLDLSLFDTESILSLDWVEEIIMSDGESKESINLS